MNARQLGSLPAKIRPGKRKLHAAHGRFNSEEFSASHAHYITSDAVEKWVARRHYYTLETRMPLIDLHQFGQVVLDDKSFCLRREKIQMPLPAGQKFRGVGCDRSLRPQAGGTVGADADYVDGWGHR